MRDRAKKGGGKTGRKEVNFPDDREQSHKGWQGAKNQPGLEREREREREKAGEVTGRGGAWNGLILKTDGVVMYQGLFCGLTE